MPFHRPGAVGWVAGATLLLLAFLAPAARTAPPAPASPRPARVSFVNDLLPVLTKRGCNGGSCHGQQSGKGGFRLSLRGWDPAFDYEQIVKADGGRRIDPTDPMRSPLLRKPLGRAPHGGGVLIQPYSAEYELFRRWLNGGRPGPDDKEPTLVEIAVAPAEATLRAGEGRSLKVLARYSDRSARDVTAYARYQSQNDAVATVSDEGAVTARRPGESAILVSYGGRVTTASLLSPYLPAPRKAPRREERSGAGQGGASARFDTLIEAKLAKLGLAASPLCTDSEFLRRAYLDTLGLLPTPKETRAFLESRAPDKRAKAIDALLERPEFVDLRTLKMADLLRVNGQLCGDEGADTYYRWLRARVEANIGYDRLVREILTARGSTFHVGAANFFRVASNPEDLAETTAQTFLGTRIACAKCHNHPFENWKQADYYGLAAFFARFGMKYGPEFGETAVFVRRDGDVTNPRTKQVAKMRYLGGGEVAGEPESDRRAVLSTWLTSPENRLFARVAVNRIWTDLFGRGIVDPVDDFRLSNPPSNAPLLEALTDEFLRSGFDAKALIRQILNTQAYQRSSVRLPGNAREERYFARAYPRRLSAEVLLDAIGQVTRKPDRFWPYPNGYRATQLRDSRYGNYFTEVFGKPKREILCACERSQQPNLAQSLHLINSGALQNKLTAGDGMVAALIKEFEPWAPAIRDRRIIEEMYYLTLCRPPSKPEADAMAAHVKKQKERKQGFEDILWALLNAEEFLFQK